MLIVNKVKKNEFRKYFVLESGFHTADLAFYRSFIGELSIVQYLTVETGKLKEKESKMKINKIAEIAKELEEKHLTAAEAKDMVEVQMKFDFRRSMPRIKYHLF